jgi:hypothetical protein
MFFMLSRIFVLLSWNVQTINTAPPVNAPAKDSNIAVDEVADVMTRLLYAHAFFRNASDAKFGLKAFRWNTIKCLLPT